jgi:putative hydrolase
VVPDNLDRFCEAWSLPAEETRLWLCVRELTAHAVVSLPHVAERIAALVDAAAVEAVGAQQGLIERLGGQVGDPDAMQRLLGDPESLMADLLAPGYRHRSDELLAVTAAVTGYVDHVSRTVSAKLGASSQTIAEAWYRYRIEEGSAEQAAATLFGLDVGQKQIDRGAAFVRGVLERAGDEGLDRLWSAPRTLPTPAEVDAPGLWLERIDLPEPDEA